MVPEATRAWAHGCGPAVVIASNALGAEVLGQEVELVGSGLEGQLMELLL